MKTAAEQSSAIITGAKVWTLHRNSVHPELSSFHGKKEKFSGNTRFTLYAPYRKYGEKYDIDANLGLRLTYKIFKVLNLNFLLSTRYYNSLYHTYAMSEDRLTKNATFRELVNIDYNFTLGLGFNF